MSPFTLETFRRTYAKGKLSIEKLDEWLSAGAITQDEYDYIKGENV